MAMIRGEKQSSSCIKLADDGKNMLLSPVPACLPAIVRFGPSFPWGLEQVQPVAACSPCCTGGNYRQRYEPLFRGCTPYSGSSSLSAQSTVVNFRKQRRASHSPQTRNTIVHHRSKGGEKLSRLPSLSTCSFRHTATCSTILGAPQRGAETRSGFPCPRASQAHPESTWSSGAGATQHPFSNMHHAGCHGW